MSTARRTDGKPYKPATEQYMGLGFMRSCAKCSKHRMQGPGWRKTAYGMTCPACLVKQQPATEGA